MPLKDPAARAAYQKAYQEKRKAELAKYHAAYRKKNRELIKSKKRKDWVERNEEHKAKLRARYKANPEKYKAASRNNYQRTQDACRAYAKNYRAANEAIVKARKLEYARTHKGVINAAVARRKAALLQRTPSWLTNDEHWIIEEAYELAARRTKLLGFDWHVDHIIPLQGKLVSGLHVPANLRVIPGIDNVRKKNTFVVA